MKPFQRAVVDDLAKAIQRDRQLLQDVRAPALLANNFDYCSAAWPSRNRIARSVWSAWSLLPLSNRPTPYDSASKLDALQTLRVAVHPQTDHS
jgi:hypothetical protein